MKLFKRKVSISMVLLCVVNVVLLGAVLFYESRTHNVQIILSTLGWCEMPDAKRPEFYWIADWTACVKKLNYEVDVAFLGNSITANSNFQNHFKDVKIAEFGYHGDRIDGMIRRVPMLKSVNPKRVFIMGGINDVHRVRTGIIIARYDSLLRTVRDSLPEAKIFVQSILPVSKKMEKLTAPNREINALNQMIRNCAEKNGCKFIDLYSSYIEEGVLPDSLTYDGVHLTQGGYGRWARIIRPYVYDGAEVADGLEMW